MNHPLFKQMKEVTKDEFFAHIYLKKLNVYPHCEIKGNDSESLWTFGKNERHDPVYGITQTFLFDEHKTYNVQKYFLMPRFVPTEAEVKRHLEEHAVSVERAEQESVEFWKQVNEKLERNK